MSLLFKDVADLLEQLYTIKTRDPPYLPKKAEERTVECIANWFRRHRRRINEDNGEALLSTLLPERRTDRVYSIKEKSLEKIIKRVMCLSNERCIDLGRYKEPGAGDLGDCVERVLKQADVVTPIRGSEVTLVEVDTILLKIASQNHFSAPSITSLAFPDTHLDASALLSGILRRLKSREAKWLTRLILKNYLPIIVPEYAVYRSFHGLFTSFLKVQATFPAAVVLLREWKGAPAGEVDILKRIRPQVGVKVGRQTFDKARSIKHCVDIAQNRRISVEKKYDGEYCQIHINLSRPRSQRIQIFSKSGKDSTNDRVRVHQAISDCLRLDEVDCIINEQCILEGELLVYNDKEKRIADFHKIRKHVTRSGIYLGTDLDSPAHSHEHLMIMFFDILMHDGKHVLSMAQRDRRVLLQDVVKVIPGRAGIAEATMLDFNSRTAAKELRALFARTIVSRGEGLILKPADDPYFNFGAYGGYKSCCVKLKKEYVGGFGDIGDFSVVGASYDAVKAKEYALPNLKWTHFWLACLENKEEVSRWNEMPRFVVVAIVCPNVQIVKALVQHASPQFVCSANNDTFKLRTADGLSRGMQMTTAFTQPLVFDVRCFAFDKEGNTGFWTPRFPQVSKIHFDRSYLDTVTFGELQSLAEEDAQRRLDGPVSQAELEWIKKLERADPRGVAVDASTQGSSRASERSTRAGTETSRVSTASPLATRSGNSQRVSTSQAASVERPNSDAENAESQGHSVKRKLFPINASTRAEKRSKTLQDVLAGDNRDSTRCVTAPTCSQNCNSQQSVCSNVARSERGSQQARNRHSQPLQDITNQSLAQSLNPAAECRKDTHKVTNARSADHNSAPNLPVASRSQLQSAHPTGNAKAQYLTPPTSSVPRPYDRIVSKNTAEPVLHGTTSSTLPLNIDDEHSSMQKAARSHRCKRCKPRELTCPLQSRLFCLSPCIANYPWVTEDLMNHHEITYVLHPKQWLGNTQAPPSYKITRTLLVDSKRTTQTKAFLERVKRLLVETRTDDNVNEAIEVYDWRLLESLMRLDQGKTTSQGCPWRRYYLGVLVRG